MERAPEHECPCRAMPDAAEKHGEEEIAIGLHLAAAIATQWYIEIVAEPGGERDVPAPPEILKARRTVGLVEVIEKAIAKQRRNADGNVAIARQVAIDLHGIAINADEKIKRTHHSGIKENRVHQFGGEIIRDHHLLGEAGKDEHQTNAKIFPRQRRCAMKL